jgi:hypothetical protein
LCEWGQESRATEGERGDRNCFRLMMAFSRAFIAGENLVAVTLVNSPTLTFLVLRACGTGLRAGKVSILRDFTWIDLRDALLIYDHVRMIASTTRNFRLPFPAKNHWPCSLYGKTKCTK